MNFLNVLIEGWNKFWFEKSDEELTSLGFFRLCFASVLLFAYCSRTPDLEFFYSENGILPSTYRASMELFKYRPTPLEGISNLGLLHGLHAIFLLSLLLLALGLFTRLSTVVAYVLHMFFLNRNITIQFGLDTIGTFFLLYLCFARSGRRLSLDARFFRSEKKQTIPSHIAWRLMQIQVCVIYAYSGLEKLKGSRWWDGSALWDVLSAGNLQRWDLSFVAHMPIVIASVVYIVLLWEIYFPALIWVPRLRIPMLVFGVLMHIGIFLFMNLPSFGFMMICLYALFLKEREILSALAFFQSKKAMLKYSKDTLSRDS